MGKKINPKIFRLGQTRTWESRWYSNKSYAKFLQQDLRIKDYLREELKNAFVSSIEIERTSKELNVIVYSARPGVIIGKSGVGVEKLKNTIKKKLVKDNKMVVNLNIKEVENPGQNAMIVAIGIKADIEKRIPFRRAMKQAIAKVEKAGAKGVKVELSGRLNGAEIARTEKLLSGKVPLHTLRADVDYAQIIAETIYGVIGIKVWIYRGDVFNKKQ